MRERFIARQPIFDTQLNVFAYELLYRSSSKAAQADVIDGEQATQSVLSDAITVFGLSNITNSRPAFVNFTEELILNDFVLNARPDEIVVELLEDIEVTPKLIEKMQMLHDKGYCLALDDFIGDGRYDEVIPLVDIIKVDFMLTDEKKQEEVAKRFSPMGIKLLAEKVETKEEVDRAIKMGYKLFQGYFFAKPSVMVGDARAMTSATYAQLLREISQREIRLDRCARVIHADATLTYELLRKVRTVRYYRGNTVTNVRMALAILGVDEIRRWIILMLARERNVTCSDEVVRAAYIRAVFMERLVKCSRWQHRSSEAFLVGMFSLLDRVMGQSIEKMLEEIAVSKDISDTLLGLNRTFFSDFLEFVIAYEQTSDEEQLPTIDIRLTEDQVVQLYVDCIIHTDKVFCQ